MAVLTTNGITFSDSTSLNSLYGIFPQLTVTVFYQTSPPTGWTKLLTHTNKALRVTSGSGGVAGGTTVFDSAFNTKTVSGTVTVTGTISQEPLSITQIPAHTHPVTLTAAGSHSHSYSRPIYSPEGGTFRQEDPVHPRISRSNTAVQTGGAGNHDHPLVIAAAGTTPALSALHNHTWSGSGPFSSTLDFDVQYIDVLFCEFS